MNAPRVRGACPGLSAPMWTGDGLLVRLMPAAPIPLDTMVGLCDAARRHGNGTIEVSARGSLQVRGLTPDSAPLFASAVAELGIATHEGVPVIAGFDGIGAEPLPSRSIKRSKSATADFYCGEGASAADVAAELRLATAIAGLALSPKISVVVDGGGPLHLDALTADIRLRAAGPHREARFGEMRFHLGLGGDGASAIWLGTVAATDAADEVLGILRIIAARGGTARAAEILRTEGVEAFRSAPAVIEPAPMPPRRMPAEMIGVHSALDGAVAVGIGLAFGHTHADALAEIIRLAAIHGAQAVRPVPDRALLLLGVSAPDALNITVAAEQVGFVAHADDPRRRIVACPGAPACASGLIPARTLASALAPAFESIDAILRNGRATATPSPQSKSAVADFDQSIGEPEPAYTRVSATQLTDRNRLLPISIGGGELLRTEPAHMTRGVAVHISGCSKGCAHPKPTALTVVGTLRGCVIVRNGSARAAPGQYVDPANLSEEILRLATKGEETADG